MPISFYLGESCYARSQRVTLSKIRHCDMCKIETENVIETDTSDGEYGPIALCEKCVLKIFNDFKENKLKETKNCKQCNDLFGVKAQEEFCPDCYEWFEEEDFTGEFFSKYKKEDLSSLEVYFEAEKRERRKKQSIP